MNLYCVCVFFRGRHDVVEVGSSDLWEESLVLIEADSQDHAVARAKTWAQTKEVTFAAAPGDKVAWRMERIDRAVLIEGPLADGTEVFSRFLRHEEAQSLMRPFD